MVQYGPEVVATLGTIWTAAAIPGSVRLQALWPLWLPWARRRFRLTEAVEAQVRHIGPRQSDRCISIRPSGVLRDPNERDEQSRGYASVNPPRVFCVPLNDCVARFEPHFFLV